MLKDDKRGFVLVKIAAVDICSKRSFLILIIFEGINYLI
jgi:hypothetical protein